MCSFSRSTLGTKGGFTLADMQKMIGRGIAPLSAILLILGAGGGFKEMLTSIHPGTIIVAHTSHWSVSPLVLAWVIAALLRVSVGSATVATVAASGIVAPLLLSHPEVPVMT
ncbi:MULTISPECIES: hypothetical protein [unclassified Caballeronia]|uniref:GntT/GntP/DsdX family permease n=1 Tax=unclassified Caballeronia TaxID=2646786 RepID=UPI0028554EC9|nr:MULTISPECIES: hypothetical protein [unclassified Caballeronia]MDR5741480.1 hypothetical protein [Caballeronia sp. LZ016]MDR5806793.1 hypothetical protein [Caballeronia sp. LZ019]